MVEATVSKRQKTTQVTNEAQDVMDSQGNYFLELSGTALSTVGKVALAIGTTGLLVLGFGLLEGFIGMSSLYVGAIAIATGIIAMILGNKLQTGFWLEGVFAV